MHNRFKLSYILITAQLEIQKLINLWLGAAALLNASKLYWEKYKLCKYLENVQVSKQAENQDKAHKPKYHQLHEELAVTYNKKWTI